MNAWIRKRRGWRGGQGPGPGGLWELQRHADLYCGQGKTLSLPVNQGCCSDSSPGRQKPPGTDLGYFFCTGFPRDGKWQTPQNIWDTLRKDSPWRRLGHGAASGWSCRAECSLSWAGRSRSRLAAGRGTRLRSHGGEEWAEKMENSGTCEGNREEGPSVPAQDLQPEAALRPGREKAGALFTLSLLRRRPGPAAPPFSSPALRGRPRN